jgi:hypothetical protein
LRSSQTLTARHAGDQAGYTESGTLPIGEVITDVMVFGLLRMLADGGEIPVEAGPGAAPNPGDVLDPLSRGPVDERVKCRTCRTSAP